MRLMVADGKKGKLGIAIILIFSMMFGLWSKPELINAQDNTQVNSALVLQQESIVTSGVTSQQYHWNWVRNQRPVYTTVHVIKADLQDPYVKLNVMTGSNGQFTQLENVTQMTRKTQAVAGINGDFYSLAGEGAPIGPQIADGKLMATPTVQLQGMYAFGITQQRQPLIEAFTFQGSITAGNGQSYPLSGMNRTYGWYNQVHSHGNAIHLYTSDWGSASRANDGATTPTEVLVVDGVINQIVPNGTIPMIPPTNGYILRAAGRGANYVNTNLKIGEQVAANISLTSMDTNQTYTDKDLQMLVGGHTLLIQEGQIINFTREISGVQGTSETSRTAVGYTQDGRYAYLITADHAGASVGITLVQLQQILVELGIWRAVLLDGGGSSTMVTRPIGEFNPQLANVPRDGAQRRVVNAIGVYTLAPAGELQGLMISGPSHLWKGEQGTYQVRAYDTYYNPLDPAQQGAEWLTDGSPIRLLSAGQLIGEQGGLANVAVVAKGIRQTLPIAVTDRNGIMKLEVIPAKSQELWQRGDKIKLTAQATLSDGSVRAIPASLLEWESFGILGQMQGDIFSFNGYPSGSREAMIIARFDKYSGRFAIRVPQETLLTNFNQIPWSIIAQRGNTSTKSSVKIATQQTERYLSLTYDFTAGDGVATQSATVIFNPNAGISLNEQVEFIRLDVMGDGKGGKLEAIFQNQAGEIFKQQIAPALNWQGTRTLRIPKPKVDKPQWIGLEINSTSLTQGEVGFDNLILENIDPRKLETSIAVQLKLGQREASIGGKLHMLDQPPQLESGRTFVPIRFVIDALGGQVTWHAAEKKVTLRRGENLLELWVGDQHLIANGARIVSDAAPVIRGNRTLLPLRVVTEQLGLQVQWNAKTKQIDIQPSSIK
jgi:exopolysaccharide biosynthesis protein